MSKSMLNHSYTSLWTTKYLEQISSGVNPSSNAFVSVAVPYSSVPHTYKVLYRRSRQYLILSPMITDRTCAVSSVYLAKTSALSTQPMMLPRWGTLLTYGRALVISMLRSPGTGNLDIWKHNNYSGPLDTRELTWGAPSSMVLVVTSAHQSMLWYPHQHQEQPE